MDCECLRYLKCLRLAIGPVVSLSDTGRFYCITLLWGGLKLANLVWLKNCGRWVCLIKFGGHRDDLPDFS